MEDGQSEHIIYKPSVLVMGTSGTEYEGELVALGNPPEQMGVFKVDEGYYVAYYDSSENRWEVMDFQEPLPISAAEDFAYIVAEMNIR